MAFQLKARRRQVAQVAGAAVDFKDAGALAATEMMMVFRAGHFIARGLTGELDRYQPAALHQRVNGPVHRGDAQLRDVRASGFKDFKRSQRSRIFLEDQPDRIALSGFAFHHGNMTRSAVACSLWSGLISRA